MKKLFFVLAFALISTIAFANNSNISAKEISDVKIEKSLYIELTKVIISEFDDHCTITVSTLDSDGNVTNSVTVTNHDGDCTAARNLAYRILGLLQ